MVCLFHQVLFECHTNIILVKNQILFFCRTQHSLLDLAFLVDISKHINVLNIKLQGRDWLINKLFEHVCPFQVKCSSASGTTQTMQLCTFSKVLCKST